MDIERPLSVTLVSWLVIGCGVLALLAAAANPQLLSANGDGTLESVRQIVSIGVEVLCGLWTLKGVRLARVLFVVIKAAAVVISGIKLSLLGLPSLIIPILVIDGAMFYFLYRKPAAQFFAGSVRKT